MAQATIFYPSNTTLQIPLNLKDRVAVTYRTPWQLTNLTLLCRVVTPSIINYYHVPDNPLNQSGTYLAPSFDNLTLGLRTFPVDCAWMLTKYDNSSYGVDSTKFSLFNEPLAARTFGISSTIGLATGASTGIPSTFTSSATQTPQSFAPANPPSTSTETSVAIAVSCVLGVLLLVSGVVIWVLYSRKRQKRRSELFNTNSYDKAELDASSSLTFNPVNEVGGSQGNNGAKEKHGIPLVEKDGRSNITEMAVPGQQAINQSELSVEQRRTERYELA